MKSSSNNYALCSWRQLPSRQYQQCSLIFPAPSIEVALNFLLSAIYRRQYLGVWGYAEAREALDLLMIMMLHPCSDGAPSTDDRLSSLSNELPLDIWSHMSSRECQKYSQIFAAPSIVVAFMLIQRAIYRYPKENTI